MEKGPQWEEGAVQRVSTHPHMYLISILLTLDNQVRTPLRALPCKERRTQSFHAAPPERQRGSRLCKTGIRNAADHRIRHRVSGILRHYASQRRRRVRQLFLRGLWQRGLFPPGTPWPRHVDALAFAPRIICKLRALLSAWAPTRVRGRSRGLRPWRERQWERVVLFSAVAAVRAACDALAGERRGGDG
jgi:hypothetical protein